MILVKENKRNNFENIVDLVKLWNTNKGLAIIFCLSLASLAGLPPFIGFFGKFYIFSSLIENGNFLAAFILLIFSVLGCVYYVRMIRFVLFTQSKEIILIKKYNYFVIFILVIITLINIFFILFQGPLIFWIQYLILKLF
jgi:NADH-quinone oxidoreductase subunit N